MFFSVIKKHFGKTKIYQFCRKLYIRILPKYIDYRNKERIIHRHYGYLSDRIFYIIRINDTNSGILAIVYLILDRLKYVEDRGYIPLIQIGDSYTVYNTFNNTNFGEFNIHDDILGKFINIWEYWFEQPTHYGFSDAKVADRVILGEAHKRLDFLDSKSMPLVFDEGRLKEVRLLFNKYIHIRSSILKKICDFCPTFFQKETKILGVCYRRYTDGNSIGSDFWQPSISLLLKKTKKDFEEKGFDYIYLYTSDDEAVNVFKNTFADKMLMANRTRGDRIMGSGPCFFPKLYNNSYLCGEEYILDTLLLSKCDALIGGINGGTNFAILLNDGSFSYIDLFYAGRGSDYSDKHEKEIIDWFCNESESNFIWERKEKNIEDERFINLWDYL